MIVHTISQARYNEFIDREKQLRDRLPEHTLDWYTYNNRVSLLEEALKACLVEVPPMPVTPKEEPKDVPFKKEVKEVSKGKKQATDVLDLEAVAAVI